MKNCQPDAIYILLQIVNTLLFNTRDGRKRKPPEKPAFWLVKPIMRWVGSRSTDALEWPPQVKQLWSLCEKLLFNQTIFQQAYGTIWGSSAHKFKTNYAKRYLEIGGTNFLMLNWLRLQVFKYGKTVSNCDLGKNSSNLQWPSKSIYIRF